MKNNKRIADYITVEEAISLAKHLFFTDSMLATKIYKSVMAETAETVTAAGTVFQAGYIAGIRAERERRRFGPGSFTDDEIAAFRQILRMLRRNSPRFAQMLATHGRNLEDVLREKERMIDYETE